MLKRPLLTVFARRSGSVMDALIRRLPLDDQALDAGDGIACLGDQQLSISLADLRF